MTALRTAVIAVVSAYRDESPMLLPPRLYEALEQLAAADLTETDGAAVRRSDPATSRAGAASVAMRAGSQRHRLLRPFVHHADLTADEAWGYTAIPVTACYWKRVSELAAAGLIEPTGATRKGRAGEAQTVYRITNAGRAVLEGLS